MRFRAIVAMRRRFGSPPTETFGPRRPGADSSAGPCRQAWEQSICETVNRSLTQGEWDRYIGTGGSPEFSCSGG